LSPGYWVSFFQSLPVNQYWWRSSSQPSHSMRVIQLLKKMIASGSPLRSAKAIGS
jgi:hypothetical protein